ncbi:MAG: FAD-dependent oxidoreductase [Comamonadaceae bacterium]|nr:MAG: FAD-dependent oxidoreductase [Comamonadaceae bacterium]
MPAHVLVAGGGIGGLAGALALVQRGHRLDVFEQAESFGEIGAGVQLSPNVTRRLQALGLGDALGLVASRPEALVVRSARHHAELARLPLASTMQRRYGAPYLCVHRAELHGLLLDALRADGRAELHTNTCIVRTEADDELVCASTTDARAFEGDALIGADGLWSRVRAQIWPEDPPPTASGHTAWRSLVEQCTLPPALRSQDVVVWLGAHLHAVAYPVRGGDWLNLVVVAEASPEGDARDWDRAASLAGLQQATGRCARTLQALLEAMPGWRAWSLSDRTPLASADAMARGRIALLGDAAHPMLPYLAQGAGMAIEDALALASAMATAGTADIPDAFARYAQSRWQRNAQVQARARRNGRVFHAHGPLRWVRDAALRTVGAGLLDQPWLYRG